MRYGSVLYRLTVVILAVGVPLALYRYGTDFDKSNSISHPGDTTGGPLTIAICLILGALFDFFLLLAVTVIWVLRHIRRTRQLIVADALAAERGS